MLHYGHLTSEEREVIYMMNLRGEVKKSIARRLNRSRSTITRELRRNACKKGYYSPIHAQECANNRRLNSYDSKLVRQDLLGAYVIEKLREGWSPQTISGRLRYEQASVYASPETIYQFIYNKDGQRMELYRQLVRKHRKRRVKCARKSNKRTIPDLVSISQRPDSVNQRASIGDFEIDLVFFKGNQSANIINMTDRKSRLVLLTKSHSKRSDEVVSAIIKKIDPLPISVRKTCTFDRGKEFAKHTLLQTKYGMQTFFCSPHSPWQKGQVENANGRLRRFLPYVTCVKKLSRKCLQSVQNHMNNQPRKCLGYRTPHEVFFDELNQINGGYCCG